MSTFVVAFFFQTFDLPGDGCWGTRHGGCYGASFTLTTQNEARSWMDTYLIRYLNLSLFYLRDVKCTILFENNKVFLPKYHQFSRTS